MRRKPPEQRSRSRPTRDLVTVREAPSEAPPPPPGMLKKSRERWFHFWSSPLASAINMTADREALERLWWLYDQRTRMERAAARKPFVLGSTGQTVLSPAYSAITRFDAEITKLEDRFGKSLKARRDLGVILGDGADAPSDIEELTDALADDDVDAAPDPRRFAVLDGRAG